MREIYVNSEPIPVEDYVYNTIEQEAYERGYGEGYTKGDSDGRYFERIKTIKQVLKEITTGLDEGIRCAMCTNIMANDRGCDGGCVVDQGMYEKVMEVIERNINHIKVENNDRA